MPPPGVGKKDDAWRMRHLATPVGERHDINSELHSCTREARAMPGMFVAE